jgi:hypothetical protein
LTRYKWFNHRNLHYKKIQIGYSKPDIFLELNGKF